jgi:hypothetical protein
VITRNILITVLIGGFTMLVFSCATVPTKPLAPGEVRLLSMLVPEKENVRLHLPFVVNISFAADGNPEIRSACFDFSGDGPHCFKVIDVDYGSPGMIKVQNRTGNAGLRRLECYVLYIRDGKIEPTNVVSTYFRVNPQ